MPNFVFPLVLVPAVAAVIFAIAVAQGKKAKANLLQLGDKLGLKLDAQGRFIKKYRLIGELRGKAVELFSYTTGSGKSQQRWAAIAVRVKASGGLTFSLKRRMSLFEFIARLFRKNSVETGDPAFDRQWVLTTNQPDFMRSALLPEMREKIVRLSGGGLSSANYKYDLYTVRYSEQGSFGSGKLCARFGEIVDLLCDLADVVEVGAEMKNSPG